MKPHHAAWTLIAIACGTPADPASQLVSSPIDLEDPAACSPCHAAVVTAWRGSQHARSHQSMDPIYAGMRALRTQREGPEVVAACDRCHAPRAEAGETAARAGVSCATCHVDGGVIRGVSDPTGAAPHPMGPPDPELVDGTTVCQRCHESLTNAAGLTTCSTGQEAAAAGAGSCTSCHMPDDPNPSGSVSKRATHRAHRFSGPHARFSDTGALTPVNLAGTLLAGEARLVVTNLAGHHAPSGFPGRVLQIQVVGVDGSGAEVWRNALAEPGKEDPQSVFTKIYVDDAGAPTLAPYGRRLLRDITLTPGESRTLSWTVPDAVVEVRFTALYGLVGPAAVGPLGLEGKDEANPRVVAEASARR